MACLIRVEEKERLYEPQVDARRVDRVERSNRPGVNFDPHDLLRREPVALFELGSIGYGRTKHGLDFLTIAIGLAKVSAIPHLARMTYFSPSDASVAI